MTPKPMVLVTIYPDGWVETRSTDDVRVKIHTVPPLKGNGSEVDAEHGISAEALKVAYEGLSRDWQTLVDETDARGLQTGQPSTLSEEERYDMAMKWVALDLFSARVEADDHLRLDLYKVTIPQWMKDHAERVRLANVAHVATTWREAYQDERQGV